MRPLAQTNRPHPARRPPAAAPVALPALGAMLVLALGPAGIPAQADGPEASAIVPPGQGTIAPSIRPEWEAPPIDDPTSVLTVTGTASVEVPADRARILLAVETEGETAREAGEANARLMTQVSEGLRAAGAGLPGFQLQTSGYSLTPVYAPIRAGQPREITGYSARNSIQVRVDDVDAAGPLIDAGLEAGANRIAGLSFEVRDPEPHRHEAVRRAVAAARAEAEVMAAALGLQLGLPVEVQGGADPWFPGPLMAQARGMEMAADAFATPVEPGSHTLSARVTVRYRLEPAP